MRIIFIKGVWSFTSIWKLKQGKILKTEIAVKSEPFVYKLPFRFFLHELPFLMNFNI